MRRMAMLLAVGLIVVGSVGPATGAGGRKLSTPLSGAEEPNNTGDPDGTGTATLTLNPGREEVCYELSWQNLDGTVEMAHIHEAPAGSNGGIVVTLFTGQSFSGVSGSASGCADDATREEIRRILRDPSAFYVNVHDSVRLSGAIRGQLER